MCSRDGPWVVAVARVRAWDLGTRRLGAAAAAAAAAAAIAMLARLAGAAGFAVVVVAIEHCWKSPCSKRSRSAFVLPRYSSHFLALLTLTRWKPAPYGSQRNLTTGLLETFFKAFVRNRVRPLQSMLLPSEPSKNSPGESHDAMPGVCRSAVSLRKQPMPLLFQSRENSRWEDVCVAATTTRTCSHVQCMLASNLDKSRKPLKVKRWTNSIHRTCSAAIGINTYMTILCLAAAPTCDHTTPPSR